MSVKEAQTSSRGGKKRSAPLMAANIEPRPANESLIATVYKEEAPSTTASSMSRLCMRDFECFLFKFKEKNKIFMCISVWFW